MPKISDMTPEEIKKICPQHPFPDGVIIYIDYRNIASKFQSQRIIAREMANYTDVVNMIDEVEKWLVNTFSFDEYRCLFRFPTQLIISFKHKDDALLLKMKWQGREINSHNM